MRVCVCVCVNMHCSEVASGIGSISRRELRMGNKSIFIRIYIYINIYACICVSVYVCVCGCVRVCACVCICIPLRLRVILDPFQDENDEWQHVKILSRSLKRLVCCSVLKCVCSVLQCVTVYCSVLQHVAVCEK